jgi:hypothetical protein
MSPYLKRRLRSLEEIRLQRRGEADLDQHDRIGGRLESPVRTPDEKGVDAIVSESNVSPRADSRN